MLSAIATATLLSKPPAFSATSKLSKDNNFSLKQYTELKLLNKNIHGTHSLQCLCRSSSDANSTRKLDAQSQSPRLYGSRLTASATALTVGASGATVVADKLNWLSSEFNSLSEPIDRVKRLLHYAALLPQLEESARLPENRVTGCATQVWLVSAMDKCGRMRFRADSDSEISKGFCWCLVWMLDGAEPEEVLMVEKEDLADMNVGLNLKAPSRVNTWHNVLFGMQKATKDLVSEMEGKAFPSLIVTPDDIDIPTKGNLSGVWQ